MHVPRYLLRHRKDDDAPYEVGAASVVIGVLALALFAFAAGQAYLLNSGSLAAVIASSLASLANGDRAANAEGALVVSPTLTAVAQAKANDMAAKGYFAHTSPEGHDPWYWFAQEGYNYSYAGENLAIDFTDSVTVEDAWMASPEHRANLLNGRYTEVGIATAQGMYDGHETTFVAEEFGAPARAPMAYAPPAPPGATQGTVHQSAAPVAAPNEGAPAVAGAAAQPSVREATTSEATSSPALAAAEPAPPAPLAAAPPAPAPAPSAGWWQVLLASPHTVLGYAYYVLAVITLLIFAYLTELELHRRHARHALEAGALLVLLLLLFTLAQYLFYAQPVLAAPFLQ